MLLICIAPSPTRAITGRWEWAYFAVGAEGTAAPIEARPPESEAIMPRRIFRSRAYQLAQEPEALVRMTLSGSRGDSSHVTRCGLIGCAGCIARSSRVFHHLARPLATPSRQASSCF